MNDTHPSIEKRFKEMMASKTGEERLMMGFSMFEFSRTLVIASIHEQLGDLSPADLKREIFLRFYANDYDTETRQKIISHLKNH